LTSPTIDGLATGAMFMTEKQGGTDIAQTATEATDHGSHWTLRGTKWFASNVSADVILTLAQVPGQGVGTRGLGMFMVPRRRPDGTRNGYRIDRLKDKLGARSMASGEVTLEDAYAVPVGELSRGFLQMAEMLNVSRLSNAMRACALMRRAVFESVQHTRQRIVFGQALFEQPLMRVTLLPLMLATEAALGLVLESAAQLDAADAGNESAQRLVRVLTPLAKYTICKQARTVTAEAMEIRGGNGYIEDWVNPRLVRDALLGSIWEGSSNVIALDVLRCLRRELAHHAVAETYLDRLRRIEEPDAASTVDRLVEQWQLVLTDGDALLGRESAEQEAVIGRFAEVMTKTVMATLLTEQAAREIATGGGHRKLLLANTYVGELLGTALALPEALSWMGQLADGGAVPRTAALDAAAQLAPSAEGIRR